MLTKIVRSIVLVIGLALVASMLNSQEAAIPELYYKSTPSYLVFDNTIPAWDRVRINERQKKRNLAFEEWISAVQAAVKHLGYDLAYKIEKSEDNPDFVQPNYARIKLVELAPKYEGAFMHFHMDLWSPGVAAKVAIANAKWSLLFPEE